jgi:hypothetical protein
MAAAVPDKTKLSVNPSLFDILAVLKILSILDQSSEKRIGMK